VALTSQRFDTEPRPVLGPYMDAGRHPMALQDGTYSKVVGVDGRFIGSLKPFPGCQRLTFGTNKNRLLDLIANSSEFNYIKAVTIQRGATSDTLNGFAVRAKISGTWQIVFVYYDTNATTWSSYTIIAVAETTRIDVTASGRYMYVAAEGIATCPRVVYWSGSALTQKAMGPQYLTLVAPTVTGASSAGALAIGTYGVAYRFYDSARNIYSAMSAVVTYDLAVDDKQIALTMPHPGGTPNDFDTVQIYRTISVGAAGSTFDGGILYQDSTMAMPAAWTTGTQVLAAGATLTDTQLVQQGVYDPWADVAGQPPNSGVIHYWQGCVFMAAAPTESGGGSGFRWSNTTAYMPEQFNASQRYVGQLADGVVTRFVEAGSTLYALTSTVIYRMQKAGTVIAFDRFHVGRGLTAPHAAHAVGNNMLLMTPMGVSLVGGNEMQIFSQLDRIMYVDWAGHLGEVVSASDAYMGASFFFNTNASHQDAVVIWQVTKTCTRLLQCPYVAATTMPHPVSGGGQRAFFLTTDGIVTYPDAERAGNHTMSTISGTLNGAVTTASATALVDSAATFGTGDAGGVIGAYVYMLTGTHAGLLYRITANTNTTTLAVAFGTTTAIGDRYAISPVPFELVLPPMKSTTQDVPDFERRIWKGIQIYAVGHAGITSNANAVWKVGAYREGGTTLADSNEIGMANGAVSGVPGSVNPGSIDGLLVEPYVACFASGVTWELTSIELLRTISKGRSL
jgi:hypothetical protein